ncbi:hypothetical protein M3Y99_01323800 [Aphelenchoides fujianensis]|nr:hypothetical protein M3Y99_01323800 [Aphelenchoides fujianensis]
MSKPENQGEFYVLDSKDQRELHVYSLKDEKWTKQTIEAGDWQSQDPYAEYFRSAKVLYAKEPQIFIEFKGI